jgi:predicted MFS family arabinose efflux permease
VANLYYAQPLLEPISRSLHVSQGAATIVITATQLGYALGLAFVLPLGDLVENRKLAARTLLGTAVALALAAACPDLAIFAVVSVLVGVTSVVAQILVPFAAHLAPEDQRGRFVGQVMSGLLLGILLARTLASFVAAAWGWRSIYVVSAVLMLVTSLALSRMLPRHRPETMTTYRRLLLSIGELVRNEPVLRRRALCQACVFGAFSAFWTVISYQLIDVHHFSQAQVGVFSLVGASGAAAAPLAGWIGDRGLGHPAAIAAVVLAAGSMVLADLAARSVVLLGVAAVLLDLAVQSHQVLSQREIYALRAEARARINSVFMGTVFVGAAISSAVAGVLHESVGWTGVTLFGAALPIGAVVIYGYDAARRRVPARAG